MILRRLRVENWRCFLSPVELGPLPEGVSILHAPNARGKSTLFEAMRMAIFDNHETTGAEISRIQPWGRRLGPKVVVEFSHQGVEYRLTKVFLADKQALLERKEKGVFVRKDEDEAAEAEVRRMFSRTAPARGLSGPQHWGLAEVLWVPQGELALTKLSGELQTDIRSALDLQLTAPGNEPAEKKLKALYDRFYPPTGKKLRTGRDGAPLVRMRKDLESARETLRAAKQKWSEFDQCSREVGNLRNCSERSRYRAEELQKLLEAERRRADEYRRLDLERGRRSEAATTAETKYAALEQKLKDLQAVRKDKTDLEEELHELDGALPQYESAKEECAAESTKARSALQELRNRQDLAEADRNTAEAAGRFVEIARRLEELEPRAGKVRQVRAEIEKLEQKSAKLLAPDAKTMKRIRKALEDRGDAQRQAEASLITLELTPEDQGSLKILSGEKQGAVNFQAGKTVKVRGAPEVVIDLKGFGGIRATGPTGSVEKLTAWRDAVAEAGRKIAELTEPFGTTEIAELEELAEKASQVKQKLETEQAKLNGLLGEIQPEALDKEIAAAKASRAAIVAKHEDWEKKSPDAVKLRTEADQKHRELRKAIAEAEKVDEKARIAQAEAEKKLDAARIKRDALAGRLKQIKTKLAELTDDGKSDAERKAELTENALAADAARGALDEIKQQLAKFGEDPALTVARMERQLKDADEDTKTAQASEKKAEGRLEQLIAEGTYSTQAQAEESAALLEREVAREELRMDAIKLLHDTVADCRKEAMDAVSGPVEAAATRIFHRIAGDSLGRISIGGSLVPEAVKPEFVTAPVPLADASGGEQEQIHFAARMALAQVFSQNERQLVVFDDVLTFTDAGRLAAVLGIFEEAAEKMQILILTCHPERYRGMERAEFMDLAEAVRDAADRLH